MHGLDEGQNGVAIFPTIWNLVALVETVSKMPVSAVAAWAMRHFFCLTSVSSSFQTSSGTARSEHQHDGRQASGHLLLNVFDAVFALHGFERGCNLTYLLDRPVYGGPLCFLARFFLRIRALPLGRPWIRQHRGT